MKNRNYFLLFPLMLISCVNIQPSPYGEEFNFERRKIGLRIIDKTFDNSTFNTTTEYNQSTFFQFPRYVKGVSLFEGLRTPAYCQKVSYLDPKAKKLLFEEDIFASGVKKTGIDISINELLIYRYVFEKYNEEVYFTEPYTLNGTIFQKSKPFKNNWQYIHVYPDTLRSSSNSDNLTFFEQKMDYITKEKADSILSSWNLIRLNY